MNRVEANQTNRMVRMSESRFIEYLFRKKNRVFILQNWHYFATGLVGVLFIAALALVGIATFGVGALAVAAIATAVATAFAAGIANLLCQAKSLKIVFASPPMPPFSSSWKILHESDLVSKPKTRLPRLPLSHFSYRNNAARLQFSAQTEPSLPSPGKALKVTL
jgi:hypothetical protein